MFIQKTVAIASILACAALSSAKADVVLDWSEFTLDAIRADRTPPPVAARGLAMVHVAMFEAINAISGNYRPYLLTDYAATGAESPDAAAAQAAHDVLISIFPSQSATFDARLDAALAAIADGIAESSGVQLGTRAAQAIVASRANDGATATVAYTPGVNPGDWQPTPPAFAASLLPHWPNVTPFCLENMAALRRGGPPPLNSVEYTSSFNETKLLGSATSSARTADQTQIALFWVDGPGSATPPGHWFKIARDVIVQRGVPQEQAARLLALIGLAVCDAGICAWDHKYAYSDWRPITAIRAADTDGNVDTQADPTWTPLIPTPPFPSYTSGHSTFSGAASRVLAAFFESDEVAFTTDSDDVPGVSRSFARFSQAASEAGRSRVYGGIHWEYDNQDGLATGREIGLFVTDNFLQPRSADIFEVDADDVVRCGPIGLFPLGLTLLGLITRLAGRRGLSRARAQRRR